MEDSLVPKKRLPADAVREKYLKKMNSLHPMLSRVKGFSGVGNFIPVLNEALNLMDRQEGEADAIGRSVTDKLSPFLPSQVAGGLGAAAYAAANMFDPVPGPNPAMVGGKIGNAFRKVDSGPLKIGEAKRLRAIKQIEPEIGKNQKLMGDISESYRDVVGQPITQKITDEEIVRKYWRSPRMKELFSSPDDAVNRANRLRTEYKAARDQENALADLMSDLKNETADSIPEQDLNQVLTLGGKEITLRELFRQFE